MKFNFVTLLIATILLSYSILPIEATCTANVYPCATCNGDNSACATCTTGTVNTNAAPDCTCSEGSWFNNNNQCLLCADSAAGTPCANSVNCELDTTPTTPVCKPLTCKSAYNIQGGVCTACNIPNCTEYNAVDNNTCTCKTCGDREQPSPAGNGDGTTCIACTGGWGPNCGGTCPSQCDDCSDEYTCVTCKDTTQTTNTNCIPCTASNCEFCDQDNATSCIECSPGFFVNPSNGNCDACSADCAQCFNFYTCQVCADNTKTAPYCTACIDINCQTCNNPTVCTDCIAGTYLPTTGGTCTQCKPFCNVCDNLTGNCADGQCQGNERTGIDCVCPAATSYSDGINVECQQCSPFCELCKYNTILKVGQCNGCKANLNRIPSNGACVCDQANGYVEVIDADGNSTCQKCAPQCNTCSLTQYNCDTCKNTSSVSTLSTPSCLCKDKYYFDSQKQSCQQCNSICSTCSDLNTCITCQNNRSNPPFCTCTYGELNGSCIVPSNNIFVPYPYGSTQATNSRCIQTQVIGGQENCKICRPDKDQFGYNKPESTATPVNPNQEQPATGLVGGTYSLRQISLSSAVSVFTCETIANENPGKTNTYDQEERTPNCGMYDNYGMCVECMVGYGLFWDSSKVQKDDAAITGQWTCIGNALRTLFCNRYDENKNCIECKWNQSPEESNLYPNNNDNDNSSYYLDFGLYSVNNEIYCINNNSAKPDPRLQYIQANFLASQLQQNCATYQQHTNPDKSVIYICVKCHSRKFNLEGQNMWKQGTTNNAGFNQYYNDYWISQTYGISDSVTSNPVCSAYPLNYITVPESLVKIVFATGNSGVLTSSSTCNNNQQMVQDQLSGNYGCVAQNINCFTNSYSFKWDYATFKSKGIWLRIFDRCTACISGYGLDENGNCQQITADSYIVSNCSIYSGDGKCTACANLYTLYLNNNAENPQYNCALTTNVDALSTPCNISVFVQNGAGDVFEQCNQCQQGYILQLDANGNKTICVHWGHYGSYDQSYVRGCDELQYFDNTTVDVDVKCNDASAPKNGWAQNGRCAGGIMPGIKELCLTPTVTTARSIPNCKIYLDVYASESDKARCQKCADGYQLSPNWISCTLLPSATPSTILNCAIQDGPWCSECSRGTTNYVLTSDNTCIVQPVGFENCLAGEYNDNNSAYRNLSKCVRCETGYQPLNGLCIKQKCDITGQVPITLYSSPSTEVCGVPVDGCYLYRDTKGNCFDCDLKDSQVLSGIIRTNGYAVCENCQADQVQMKNHLGEMVCADDIQFCQIFNSEYNYCMQCIPDYALYIVGVKDIRCQPKADCAAGNLHYEAYTQSLACVDTVDTNCRQYNTGMGTYVLYQDQIKTNTQVKWRCADCNSELTQPKTYENTYYINADNNYICTKYSEWNINSEALRPNLDDTNINKGNIDNQWTIVWKNAQGSNVEGIPQLQVQQGQFLNSPCAIRMQSVFPTTLPDLTVSANPILLFQKLQYTYAENQNRCVDNANVNEQSILNCMVLSNKPVTVDSNNQLQCSHCAPGFILNKEQTACTNAAVFPLQSVLYSGSVVLATQQPITNCIYQQGNVCNYCERGYNLSVGVCVKQPHPACTKQTASVCTVCQFPYVVVSGSCYLKIQNCLVQTTTVGVCDTCVFGYQWYNNMCVRKTAGCESQDFTLSEVVGNQVITGVCSNCMKEDSYIRYQLDYNGNLGSFCVLGCSVLTRRMSERKSSNPYNLWTCDECRKDNFSLDTKTSTCAQINTQSNCSLYSQGADGTVPTCISCLFPSYNELNNDTQYGYYLNGGTCETCNLFAECMTYDEQSTKKNGDNCVCTVCNQTPNKMYVNEQGGCTVVNIIANCATYDNKGVCTSCTVGQFFLNGTQCVGYTVQNCATFNPTEDRCASCNMGSSSGSSIVANNYLNSDGQCVDGSITNCYIYSSADKCSQCQDNYGLSPVKDECISNNDSNGKGNVSNCYQYGDIQNNITKYACITCQNTQLTQKSTGYVLDYESQKCIQLNYCLSGVQADDGSNYCLECSQQVIVNGATSRVFKTTNNDKSTCGLELPSSPATGGITTSPSYQIQFCAIYSNYDQLTTANQATFAPICVQCHPGFTSDWAGDNESYGRNCISDNNPGAVPGCKYYQKMEYSNGSVVEYQKYEYLRCRQCNNQWHFYQFTANNNSYNYNTFSQVCDRVITFTAPTYSQETFAGTDGGVMNFNDKPSDDDDDDDDDNSGDKDHYKDPVVSANILAVSLETIVAVVFTAVLIFA